MSETGHSAEGSVGGFRNQQLDPSALPDFTEVMLEPVARGYMTYVVVLWGLVVGLPVVLVASVVGALVFEVGIGVAAGGVAALLAAVLAAYGYLNARVFGWALREHDLVTREGVVWHKTVVVPQVRIQHVEITSGPLERAFGTVRLQVFTAGSGSADLVIYGLEPERAKRLRDHLRSPTGYGTAVTAADVHD